MSGKDFILAVALGVDVMVRLGRAIRRSPQGRDEWTMDKGWFGTQLFGFMSGAATVGKLLRLSEAQMVHALGIASGQLCGSRQMGSTPPLRQGRSSWLDGERSDLVCVACPERGYWRNGKPGRQVWIV